MRQTLLSLLAARRQGRADLLLDVFSQQRSVSGLMWHRSAYCPNLQMSSTATGVTPAEFEKLQVPLWSHAMPLCACVS